MADILSGDLSPYHEMIKFAYPVEYAFLDLGTMLGDISSNPSIKIQPGRQENDSRIYDFESDFAASGTKVSFKGSLAISNTSNLITSVQATTSLGGTINVVKTYTNDPVPLIASLEIQSALGTKDIITFTPLNETLPDISYRLSGYDLPEPDGIEWKNKPSQLPIYLLVITATLLIVAAIFFVLYKRTNHRNINKI